jgi:hypothetical protein
MGVAKVSRLIVAADGWWRSPSVRCVETSVRRKSPSTWFPRSVWGICSRSNKLSAQAGRKLLPEARFYRFYKYAPGGPQGVS